MRTKAEIRSELKLRRQSMTEEEARASNQKILNMLSKNIDWSAVSSLNTYLSVAEWNEVDTWSLLEYVWKNWPHIQTSTMRITDNTMQAVVIDPSTEWVQHEWGVSEPKGGQVLTEDHNYDVIIVPVLGFDDQNNRLGLGKGYYDRFLKSQSQAQKIGLAYSWGKVKLLPYESHDIKLDKIVTDTE